MKKKIVITTPDGKKIEKVEATKEEQEELQRLIDEIVGVRNE